MLKKFLMLAVGATFCLPALAGEADVKKAVEAKLGGPKVTSVTKAGYLGLYEVFVDGQIIYTDEKVSALLAGSLIDGKTMKNVTSARVQKLTAINFNELPFELAVKQVRGNGKRLLVTFEDPNCGYCKRLAKDLTKMDNLTLYTFLTPILSPDSLEKSNRIWCAADKAKAWNDWMLEGKAPDGKGDCDTTPVQKSAALGQKLGVSGTPTLFFSDGSRVPGAIPLAQIEKKLEEIASSK